LLIKTEIAETESLNQKQVVNKLLTNC